MMPLYPLNRIALACLGYWPGGIQVQDCRKDKSKRANILVVAPHMTFVDSLMVAVAFPPVPSGVGMTGIFNYPVMKSLAIAAQTIFVDREHPESRHACKDAIQTRASSKWTGPPTMIFPEGVITNGTNLIQFKVGAFSTGEPVTPVCLRYVWQHYNPSGCGKNSNAGIALLRSMLQFKNRCEIKILDTYVPSSEEKADPLIFAKNVRTLMASQLGVPCTDHSYEDAKLGYESKAKVGCDFEVAQLKSTYGYSMEELTELMKLFGHFDTSSSGAVSKKEFAEFIRSADSAFECDESLASRLFEFIDSDESGSIEFPEFVELAALLSGRRTTMSRTWLAFLVRDIKGTGKVERKLLRSVLDDSSGGSEDADEFDIEDFSQLAKRHPDVLEAALDPLRSCLGLPSLEKKVQ